MKRRSLDTVQDLLLAIAQIKPGPTIAFLAEFDALPGIGHACGHNLFGTYSVLAASIIKKQIDEIGGEIRVYGTPGEEGGEKWISERELCS